MADNWTIGFGSVPGGVAGGPVDFNVNATGDGPFTYHWDFDDGVTADVAAPSHTYADDGTYYVVVTVTAPGGRNVTAGVYVDIAPAPTPPTGPTAAAPSRIVGTAGRQIFFSGTGTGDGPLAYHWDFGDGSASDVAMAIHTYSTPATYVATLAVTDAHGAKAVAHAIVTVGEASDPHPTDPTKDAEHEAMEALVRDDDATVFAVHSGFWGEEGVWSTGEVPDHGGRVVVPFGVAVVVAVDYSDVSLGWVRVDGKLTFVPEVSTGLKAVTLVVTPTGTLEIGTAAQRVAADKTCRIVVGDRGARDEAQREYDPMDLSGTVMSHGAVSVYGARKDGRAWPVATPMPGDVFVSFASAPYGWQAGDRLLFPGTELGVDQDEVRTITSLSDDDLHVVFDSPLQFKHGGIYGFDAPAPVGNLTRNVVFTSENADDITRRGHVMWMHSNKVHIDSAAFVGLGRTDASRPHTPPEADDNTIGRYACHAHIRSGAKKSQPPIVYAHCVAEDSPKHGFVNHGGYVNGDDLVTYRCNGSGFFVENGSEIGSVTNGMFVRSNGSGDDGPGRVSGVPGFPIDFGAGGHGVWSQSGGVKVSDCFASGHTSASFELFQSPLPDSSYPGQADAVFLAENLDDPGIANGAPFVNVQTVPFTFARNVGLASKIGLTTWDINLDYSIPGTVSKITGCTFALNERGWSAVYSRQIDMEDTTLVGVDPKDFNVTAFAYKGVESNVETAFITLRNCTIDGYAAGVIAPNHGPFTIEGGFINGIVKVDVLPPWGGGTLTIDGVTWGTLRGEQPYKIRLSNTPDSLEPKVFPLYTQQFRFAYNGEQVYYDCQAPDAVPFPASPYPQFAGKTNQQLWDQYRLCVGGRLAPTTVVPHPDIDGGKVGADVPPDPVLTVPTAENVYPVVGWPVPLKTYNSDISFTAYVGSDPYPITAALAPGLNLVPVPATPARYVLVSQG